MIGTTLLRELMELTNFPTTMTNLNPSFRQLATILVALTISGCSARHPSMATFEGRSNKMWDRIGAELAKASKSQKASRILLIRQDDSTLANLGPGQDLMEQSFKKSIGARSEIAVVSIAAIAPPEKENLAHPVDLMHRLEPQLLNEALAKNGAAPLLVSLLGEPTSPPPAGTKWPPIVCFSRDGSTNLAQLIRSGVVVAAVAQRHSPPDKNEKDWFALRYTVIDRGNIEHW